VYLCSSTSVESTQPMPFLNLVAQAPDPLLALAGVAAADVREHRLDLSVGIYRDDSRRTPIMRAVRHAEQRLIETEFTKSYQSVEGDRVFLDLLGAALFGAAGLPHHVAAIQSPGGTRALRIAAEQLSANSPGRAIWIGTPTWSNHLPVVSAGGLTPRCFQQFDVRTQRLDLDAIFAAIDQAAPGDAFLIQPVCQNPTGADIPLEAIAPLAGRLAERQLVAVLDLAYHGFGETLEADAARLAAFVRHLPDALVAYSCSKNFGLYRDRVGALFSLNQTPAQRDLIAGNLQALARANYSMPPAHGAGIVRTILADAALADEWRAELRDMSHRVRAVRQALAAHGRVGPVDLAAVAGQAGMFSLLALPQPAIGALRRDHAIYLPGSARINLAGLALADVPALVAALREVSALVAA
jgi:aromatic-amino-acid transaminase